MKKIIKLFIADAFFVIGIKFTIASAKMSGYEDMATSLKDNLNHPISRWGKQR
jgi:hypothetical protein